MSRNRTRNRPVSPVAILTALFAFHAWASPLQLHVAPTGNDAWSGAIPTPNAENTDGPLATPNAALERIAKEKEMRKDAFEGAVITVHEGVYRLTKPLSFDVKNAGEPNAPVILLAPRGETVVLSGGLKVSQWTPHPKGGFQADLSQVGENAEFNSKLLFCNGKRMDLARYPNRVADAPICGGWAFVDGEPLAMYSETEGDKVTLAIREEDVRSWSNPTDGELYVFPRYNWWNNVLPIKSVDLAERTLTTAKPASYQMRPGDRYFVQGMREELDAPGEWYLDRETRILRFFPPENLSPNGAVVEIPQVKTVFEIQRAGHVRIEGFVIECAEQYGIHTYQSEGVEVRRCTIRNLGSICSWGSAGIHFRGYDNLATGNDIYDVGAKGVYAFGGDWKTLRAGNNVVENNYIHHTGIVSKQGFAVRIDGVGNRIAHNYVHDIPREGLSWGGNDHVIEYNHVRHTNTEISDTAIINACNGSWVKRGTVIRYNYLHDPIGFGKNHKQEWVSPYYCWAIYLDNWTCGTHVYGNICVGAQLGLCHNHGGRDNIIENNINIDGVSYQFSWQSWKPKTPQQADKILKEFETYAETEPYAKYPGIKSMLDMSLDERYEMSGTRLERNIFSYATDTYAVSVSDLPFTKTVSNSNLFHPMAGPVKIRHSGWKSEESWDKWREAGFDTDSIVGDPLFVDREHRDFHLKPESPAWKLGFKEIPIDKIGCYKSDDRASWPIIDAEGVREHPLRVELMPKPPEVIFSRPSYEPPRKKTGDIIIDGDIDADWPSHVDFKHGLTINALVQGGRTKRPSYGYLTYDDTYLYVCMRNLVDPKTPLKTESVWNKNDAVELALRTPQGDKNAPIFVLRGFPNGDLFSVTDSGISEARAEAAGKDTLFAAKAQSTGQWCAEWRIPFSAIGVEKARGATFDLNLTCRKTAHDEWVMWNATNAASWKVSRAGTIKLN